MTDPTRPRLISAADAVPDRGGQGLNFRHMLDVARAGFEVGTFARALVPGVPGDVVPPSRRAGLIHRLPLVRRLRNWAVLFQAIDFDRWVAGRLQPADVFLGQAGMCRDAARAARRLGARFALDVTTTHVDHLGQAQDAEGARFGVRPFFHPRLRARIREEYREADLIRVMSHVAGRTLIDRGVPAEKVVVATPPLIEGPVPLARFDGPVFRVLFVGLIEPAKGFHYLVEAFGRLPHADAELEIWGSPGARSIGAYLSERTAADPRIRLRAEGVRAGGFENSYGRASVVVLPSLADGFGYVAGEAMACGVPVIVTTATGAADLVADGVNGYVVPPADANALADRLRHLADRPDLVRSMGAAARATAAGYTPEAFRAALLPPLLRLAGRAAAPTARGERACSI